MPKVVTAPPPTAPATNLMITTGDTRMSVMPQLAFPAPVQLPEPLAGLNAGLDTADKYAQLAQNEQMNPLRQQLAQLSVQEAQKNLLKPVLQPTYQERIPTDRQPPAVFDQAGYDKDYGDAYNDAYDEAVDTGSNPEVADHYAHQKAASIVNADTYWAAQPVVQDWSVKKHFTDLGTGKEVVQTEVGKTAEEIAAEAALGNERNARFTQGHFTRVTIMQTDADGNKVPVLMNLNVDTNELTPLGTNASLAITQGTADARIRKMAQDYEIAAQTQQGQAIYAQMGLADKAVRQQYAVAAAHAGISLSAFVLGSQRPNAADIYGYLKARASGIPVNAIMAANGIAYSPQVVKDAEDVQAQAAQYEKGLANARASANTPTQPADASFFQPGAPVAVAPMSNPAVAGQSGVTVLPKVNFPVPAGAASSAPRAAVAYLLLHPELKADFDGKYGTGAADQILNAHP